jgi:hypothetical protein
MTTIITTVRTYRRSLAVVGALAVLVLAVVALLLLKTSQVPNVHGLVIGHLPTFVRALLGGGRFGS